MQDWLVALPVWGDRYHELFADKVWPSIARALAGVSGRVRYCVHTDNPDKIRALIGNDANALFLWPVAGDTWMSYAQAHREAASFARNGEAIAFLNADILTSQECFAAAEARFAEGKRAFVMQATRTVGDVFGNTPPPATARELLAWSLTFMHNIHREMIHPQGQSTVPSVLYFTDGANVILRGFFLHPFAMLKQGRLAFNGTIDQDGLDDLPIEAIHVVTDPDEAALAEISVNAARRLPSLPHPMSDQTILHWAIGSTSKHHREFFKRRIVLYGSGDTTCDAAADVIVLKLRALNEGIGDMTRAELIDIIDVVEMGMRSRWNQGAIQHYRGNMTNAVARWAEAMDYASTAADKIGIPRSPRYLLDIDWCCNAGHPAFLDIFTKMMQLGMSDGIEYVALVDDDKPRLPAYFDLWRKHIKVIPRKDYPHEYRLTHDSVAVIKLNGKWQWFMSVLDQVEARWRAQGRKPLINLSDAQVKAGWQKINLDPKRDWFVTMHCRAYGDGQSGRDGTADSYVLAEQAIKAAGGHVFWIPTGAPVGSTISGDGDLDVFLLAQARFVVSNNSGPAWIAGTFGTPLIGADWWPPGVNYPYQGRVLLKKLRRIDSGEYLSSEEMLTEPFDHLQEQGQMRELGVELVGNGPHLIAAAVKVMLQRTGSKAHDHRRRNAA